MGTQIDGCMRRNRESYKVTSANIASFQERVTKHFITDLKNNIVCRFTSQDVVSSFSIFGPEKMPPQGTTDLSCYVKDCMDTTLKIMGKILQPNQYYQKRVLSQLWFPLILLWNGKVSQIHRSTARGGHEGTIEGINHEQHAHSNVP